VRNVFTLTLCLFLTSCSGEKKPSEVEQNRPDAGKSADKVEADRLAGELRELKAARERERLDAVGRERAEQSQQEAARQEAWRQSQQRAAQEEARREAEIQKEIDLLPRSIYEVVVGIRDKLKRGVFRFSDVSDRERVTIRDYPRLVMNHELRRQIVEASRRDVQVNRIVEKRGWSNTPREADMRYSMFFLSPLVKNSILKTADRLRQVGSVAQLEDPYKRVVQMYPEYFE
jgi:hypothetical protein